MANFVTAIVGFTLFFVVFYGATKLMGYAFRKRKNKDEMTSAEERDGASEK